MSIYKAYDIRGIYGEDLTQKEAYLFGYYLVKFTSIDKIKISHDLRNSYMPLTKFLIQGLIDANCEVIYLGENSTPSFYYSLFHGINTGIMITASHNAKEYNGFKTVISGDSLDSTNGLFEVEKLAKKDSENKLNDFNLIKESIEKENFFDFLTEREIEKSNDVKDYVTYLRDFYDRTLTEDEKNVLESIKFTLDLSSGVSGLTIPNLAQALRFRVNLINHIPDGNFPNHSPDPLKARLYKKFKSKEYFFHSSIWWRRR